MTMKQYNLLLVRQNSKNSTWSHCQKFTIHILMLYVLSFLAVSIIGIYRLKTVATLQRDFAGLINLTIYVRLIKKIYIP